MCDQIEQFDDIKDTRYKNGIWWIASYPKSGNTWVRMFVNCAVTKFPVNLNASFQYVANDLVGYLYQTTSVLPLGDMGLREAIYLRPAALINHLSINLGRDCCLKTHHANIHVDNIPMCPAKLSKGAVYVIRDPRDVVVSFAKHVDKPIDETIGLMNSENACIHKSDSLLFHYLRTWSDHVRTWTCEDNPIPTVIIRYEDMLSNPQKELEAALKGLGLDEYVTEDAFKFAMEQTTFENLKKAEDETGFREVGKSGRFFNRGVAGGWKDVLTAEQAKRIEVDHAEVMRDFGYL